MFENILGQEHVVKRLEDDISSGSLASSMLFFGPNYSAKLSTALELARVLSCQKEALWSCSCGSCRRQREMTHPDLLMAGPRYFLRELDGSAEVLRRTQQTFARYLMIRAARKLTRRFDPWIWEGEESKLKGVRSSLDAVEEIIDSIGPSSGEIPVKALEKQIASLNGEAARIVKSVNLSHIPIFMIRNIAAWAHTTGQGRGKTILLENADAMLDGARNALLKILEEPPEGVHFILTSTRKGSLLPTIISRLRPYGFRERDKEGDSEVLERIFREPSGEYSTLREYFLGFDIGTAELRHHAGTLVNLALGLPSEGDLSQIFTLLGEGKERFIPLLEESEGVLHEMLRVREGYPPLDALERLHRKLQRSRRMFESYNQNPDILLEGLLYGGGA